jgi:predicted ABC-type ATPase
MISRTERPALLVFAGPNGSGKTTVSDSVPRVGLYINADDIKGRSGCTDIEAAIEAEQLREYCLSKRKSFSFETVLSTDRNMDLIRRAKDAGYYVDCYFVLTADPEVNHFRVYARRLKGGHDVPRAKISDRYYKSLNNIPRLIPLCDNIRIVDNTDVPFMIYIKKGRAWPVISENKYWTKDRIDALVCGAGASGE